MPNVAKASKAPSGAGKPSTTKKAKDEIYVRKGTGAPATLMEKLGIKAGQRVLIVGGLDEEFAQALKAAGADVSTRKRGENDVIFLRADSDGDLGQLWPLQEQMKRNGAIWVIRPRGVKTITEMDVLNTGKAAGLVDVKVARFSETHTAEKFVIPVANR